MLRVWGIKQRESNLHVHPERPHVLECHIKHSGGQGGAGGQTGDIKQSSGLDRLGNYMSAMQTQVNTGLELKTRLELNTGLEFQGNYKYLKQRTVN